MWSALPWHLAPAAALRRAPGRPPPDRQVHTASPNPFTGPDPPRTGPVVGRHRGVDLHACRLGEETAPLTRGTGPGARGLRPSAGCPPSSTYRALLSAPPPAPVSRARSWARSRSCSPCSVRSPSAPRTSWPRRRARRGQARIRDGRRCPRTRVVPHRPSRVRNTQSSSEPATLRRTQSAVCQRVKPGLVLKCAAQTPQPASGRVDPPAPPGPLPNPIWSPRSPG